MSSVMRGLVLADTRGLISLVTFRVIGDRQPPVTLRAEVIDLEGPALPSFLGPPLRLILREQVLGGSNSVQAQDHQEHQERRARH